jgi:hypothetical protein
VAEPSQGAGFTGEAFGEARITPRLGRENLQGHYAVEARLAGLIDRAHAASSDQLKDLELGKELGDGLDWWRNEADIPATLASRGSPEAGLHQALRADPLRRIGCQRLPAAWTCSLSIHNCRSTWF